MKFSFSSVVKQYFEIQVYDVFVIRGNTAIFKCQIPSFVTDHVDLVEWVSTENETFKFGNEFGATFLKSKLWFPLPSFTFNIILSIDSTAVCRPKRVLFRHATNFFDILVRFVFSYFCLLSKTYFQSCRIIIRLMWWTSTCWKETQQFLNVTFQVLCQTLCSLMLGLMRRLAKNLNPTWVKDWVQT